MNFWDKIKTNTSRRAFALITTLAILALMMILVVAFLSLAQLEQLIGSSSASNQRCTILARSAAQILLSDLEHEIAAGSLTDTLSLPAGAVRVYEPRTTNTGLQILGGGHQISSAPSLVPQRAVKPGAQPANLVKQSGNTIPFFAAVSGYDNTGLPAIPNRASAVATTVKPTQGRAFTTSRWQTPGFAAANEAVIAPDWIYLNRNGKTPTTFAGGASGWGDNAPANQNYIIGRFAYNLYEVGGLLDINILGNKLDSLENSRRGRLHQATLAGAPGDLSVPAFANFVNWRSPFDTGSGNGTGELFDPKRDFAQAHPQGQAFVNRSDLLAYVSQPGAHLPSSVVRYLTTRSRDVNAPIYRPEPNRPLLPASPSPELLNPVLNSARFTSATTLTRGTDADVEIAPGAPALARRFPLSKINIFADAAPDPQDLLYYFGLSKQTDGSYRYVATSTDGRIKRLDEVAAEKREPNFFELLQAVIITGSLGRNAGNSLTIDQPRDSLRNLQVIQIGANIIDQWDEDDFPTAVGFPSGNPGDWLMSYGTENLPYINSFEVVTHCPEWNRSRFQTWLLFSVWNPHQEAAKPAKDIAEFRIHPHSGSAEILSVYRLGIPGALMNKLNSATTFSNNTYTIGSSQSITQSMAILNKDRELTFPNDGSYQETKAVRAFKPKSESDHVGILIGHITTNPHEAVQPHFVYAPPPIVENPLNLTSVARNGYTNSNVKYPGVNQILQYIRENKLPPPTPAELDAARVPPDGTGFFGAKTFNYFRVLGSPNNRPVIHLQYRPAGSNQWITYQVIDRLIPHSSNLDGGDPQTRGYAAGSITGVNRPTNALDLHLEPDRVSLPSASGWVLDENRDFFGWRNEGANSTEKVGFSGYKIDPRTIRFGHPGHTSLTLGDPNVLPLKPRTIQTTAATPPWTSYSGTALLEFNKLWIAYKGDYGLGPAKTIAGLIPDPYLPGIFQYVDLPIQGNKPSGATSVVGFVRNIPEGSLNFSTNTSRYRDRDDIIRPADGYLGVGLPLPIPGDGDLLNRPVMLNRPFRSVGEMGYAFRDLPWKTIDFMTRNSGDTGLLDVFTLDESKHSIPLAAGKVNLNTASSEVLQVLLLNTAKRPDGSALITSAEAKIIADSIVEERKARGPFRDRGDLVLRVLTPISSTNPGIITEVRKQEREAAIRTLSEIGTTRTWNFLLDLVVQTGRFAPTATNAGQFIVRAEQRYWVHLALDRLTGAVVDSHWEAIHD